MKKMEATAEKYWPVRIYDQGQKGVRKFASLFCTDVGADAGGSWNGQCRGPLGTGGSTKERGRSHRKSPYRE